MLRGSPHISSDTCIGGNPLSILIAFDVEALAVVNQVFYIHYRIVVLYLLISSGAYLERNLKCIIIYKPNLCRLF